MSTVTPIEDKHHYVRCECTSAEHTLVFRVWNDEIFVETHLSKYLPWYKRVVLAVKYVFGYQCKYGAFAEFIWKKPQAQLVRSMLTDWLIKYKEPTKKEN